jgi:hypothetical protein
MASQSCTPSTIFTNSTTSWYTASLPRLVNNTLLCGGSPFTYNQTVLKKCCSPAYWDSAGNITSPVGNNSALWPAACVAFCSISPSPTILSGPNMTAFYPQSEYYTSNQFWDCLKNQHGGKYPADNDGWWCTGVSSRGPDDCPYDVKDRWVGCKDYGSSELLIWNGSQFVLNDTSTTTSSTKPSAFASSRVTSSGEQMMADVGNIVLFGIVGFAILSSL